MTLQILPEDRTEYQKDDGSRNALNKFMEDKDKNTQAFLKLLIVNQEFWKCRVLLELIWDYEAHRNTKSETGSEPETK